MAVVGSRHPLVIEGMSMDAPISGSGAAAVVISSATIAASAYFALGSHPCPLLLLGTFYAAGAAEIIVLCRVTVPNWLQAVLILLIIATLTTLTARTDVFGVRHASAAIPELAAGDVDERTVPTASGGASHAAAVAATSADAAGSASHADSGAKVTFEPASTGDEGWAKTLNSAYDRHLGGPQASGYRISGNVGAKRIGKATNVQVSWGVSTSDSEVHCGSTSAYGSSDPALSDQIRQGLGQAISRSLELRRPSCQ